MSAILSILVHYIITKLISKHVRKFLRLNYSVVRVMAF